MELLVSDWLKFKKMFWEKVQNEVFQGLHRNSWIEKHPCHVQFYLSHLWRKSLKARHGYSQGFTNPWYNIALTVALKMSSLGDWINFSNTIKPRITIFDTHIDPGGYMPAKLVSPDLGLILWFIEFELMSIVCDQVSFSITIQPSYICSHFFGPHIVHGGHMSARHLSLDIDLIFIVYWWLCKVCQVPWLPRALVITIRHMIIIFGPCIVIVG
jgi:hypothetical protein